MIEIISRIWRPVLTFLLVLTGLLFFILWLGAVIGTTFAYPYFHQIFPTHSLAVAAGIFNLVMVVGLTLFSFGMLLARLAFGTRLHRGWRTGLSVFAGLNIMSFFLVLSLLASQFSTQADLTRSQVLADLPSDTLRLERVGFQGIPDFSMDDEFFFADGRFWCRQVELAIERTEEEHFEVEEYRYARGRTHDDALELAERVPYQWDLAGNQLSVPDHFGLDSGEHGKWRVQKVRLTLRVPDGKYLYLDPKLRSMLKRIDLADREVSPWREAGQVWKMGATGLRCVGCDATTEDLSGVEDTKPSSFKDFRHLKINGRLKVMIDQGDLFEVRLSGPTQYTRETVVTQEGDILSVSARLDPTDSPVRLYLTMPELLELEATATDDIRVRGFDQRSMQISTSGSFQLKLESSVDSLRVRQEGANEVALWGHFGWLEAQLANRAHLDADEAEIGQSIIANDESSRVSLPSGKEQ